MAAKWTIDNINRLFIVKAGVTDLDVQVDLYSDWKEEYLLSPNSAYPPAMRAVGGDPVSDTQSLGSTYFMINGWRIRPQEASHTLNVVGNLYTDPAGESPFVDTLGVYNVRIIQNVSNLVDASVARLDLNQLLQGIYIDTVNGSDTNEGTPTSPVQTEAAALALASANNLARYYFTGTLTLNNTYSHWKFIGTSSPEYDVLNANGQILDECSGEDITLTGTLASDTNTNSKFSCEDCLIDNVSGYDGVLKRCGLKNYLGFGDNSIPVLDSCFSQVAGNSRPVLDCGVNSQIVYLNVRNYSGGITVSNMNSVNEIASLDVDPGTVEVDSSCVQGEVLVRGTGEFYNNSAGVTVYDNFLSKSDFFTVADIWNHDISANATTGTAGKVLNDAAKNAKNAFAVAAAGG